MHKFSKKIFAFLCLAALQLPCTLLAQNAPISAGGLTGTLTAPAQALADLQIKGPDPAIDVLNPSVGIFGDLKVTHNAGVSGATVTIAAGSVFFASSDCSTGSGCTGASNKVIGFNGGGPSGTITVAAPTPGSGGQLVSNINYRYQFSQIIDNATLPIVGGGAAGDTVNGWTLPTTEATIAEGAHTSLAFGAPSASVTNATGQRIYVSSPFGSAANSGEEVMQVPGSVAFGTELTGGTGCVAGESITIGAPSQSGGVQAVAIAVCPSGVLTGVQIQNGGSGYTSNPTGTLSTGTGTLSLTVGMLCGSQSAKNFRDSACDITGGITLNSVSMVGPLVPTIAGWRSTVTAYASTTSATIGDTIPNNLTGNNFAAWGTENTTAWVNNVLAYSNCTPPTPPTIGTAGCHVIFPSAGSNNAPTGRYLFLNGLPILNNGMTVEGRGGRGSPPNAGFAAWEGPKASAEIVELGDAYGIIVGGATTNGIQGIRTVNLATEDILEGVGWAGYEVGGIIYGQSNVGTHVQLVDPTVVNFVGGYAYLITDLQQFELRNAWGHGMVGLRIADNVSAGYIDGGLISGALNTTGLSWGTWISNSPLSLVTNIGNIVFVGTQLRDFYQGDKRISDMSYIRFMGMKTENVGLSGGASCTGGTGTACYGVHLLTEGNTAGRCINNEDSMTQSARNVNFLSETIPTSGGTACSQTDIVDPAPTSSSGNLCVQSPCNLNDSSLDLRLGNNSRSPVSIASFQAGGMAFGPDILTGTTPAIACANGNIHTYRSLTASATPTFSGTSCADGQEISVEVCENATGGFTWTWPSGFNNPTAINPAANACTAEVFHWDATNSIAVRDLNATNQLPTGSDTGAVNAYVVANLTPAMTSYQKGNIGCFTAANANTSGTVTVNFSSLGTKTVAKQGEAALYATGDIGTATVSCMVYDGTDFILLNPQAHTGTGVAVAANAPAFTASISLGSTAALLDSGTPPTVASGFASSGTTITDAGGSRAFGITIGTTPGSTGTLTFPAATHGWHVHCDDLTTQSTSVSHTQQTGAVSTTSVTLTQFSDVEVATAWVAADVLSCIASPY